MSLKVLGSILLAIQLCAGAFASDPGFRVPSRFFVPKALLFEKTPTETQLAAYIKKMAPNRSQILIDNRMLAREILETSSCFNIDPLVFTGLIHTESTFNNEAQSGTGAVGFTQFTSIGLREVHDQLGERGKKGAITSTIKFWKTIFADCIDPEWMPLWKRTAHLPKEEVVPYQKKILKRDPMLSLAYGALLFKLYWGRQSQLWEDRTDVTAKDTFLRALARYNGEPNGRAEEYAKKVLLRAQRLNDSL